MNEEIEKTIVERKSQEQIKQAKTLLFSTFLDFKYTKLTIELVTVLIH